MKRLLYFKAAWCQPCKMQGPIIDELKEDKFNVKKVDVDDDKNEKIVTKYGVMSIPTLIVVEKGKEVKRFVGLQTKQVLTDALR